MIFGYENCFVDGYIRIIYLFATEIVLLKATLKVLISCYENCVGGQTKSIDLFVTRIRCADCHSKNTTHDTQDACNKYFSGCLRTKHFSRKFYPLCGFWNIYILLIVS